MLFKQKQVNPNFDNKPAGRPPAPQTEMAQAKNSRGRQVLLFILPIIALVLVGILILLIINMPQPKEIQLERYTRPRQEEKLQAPQPKTTQVSETNAPSRAAEPTASYRLVSRAISRDNLSKLISTGAGIPPGLQPAAVQLVANPPTLVWQPPQGGSPKMPAVVGEERSLPPPTEEASQTPSDQVPTESELLPSLPVTEQAPPLETESSPASSEVLAPDPTTPAAPEDAGLQDSATDNAGNLDTPEAPLAQEMGNEDLVLDNTQELNDAGFYATQMQAYVYGELVNVRADASMDSEVLAEVFLGDQVYEISTNGSWSRVQLADGFEGYIFSSLLSYNYVAPSPEPPAEVIPEYEESDFSPYYGVLYSTFSGVNIRALPSVDSELIGSLYYGESVSVTGYTGGWFQVMLEDGSIAYVHGDFLSEEAVEVEDISGEVLHEPVQNIVADLPDYETPADLAGGNAIVGLAMQYQGYPYVYGAAGPSSFDCSGFTSYIYGQMGVGLGRTTYDQVNNGIPVSFSYKNYANMVPGDLVLFATGAGIGHVGIYIGGGQFIHAANESVGVVIDSLNMDYWASSLAHVRRIFY